MTVRDLWRELLAAYAINPAPWLEALAGATVTVVVAEDLVTLTAATSSPWREWLQAKLSHSASRKATAIAGRRVRVEFVEVEG
jgi:hypothetical protein